ncbi:MAG: hypothetical protein AB8G05_09670 [Oligoflexales bacterium]
MKSKSRQLSKVKRECLYFEEQVQRYRRSIKDFVCNSYQMQSSGFVPIDILEVKKILRETSLWFQMPEDVLISSYQRLRDMSDRLTAFMINQAS